MDIPQVIASRFRVECEVGRGGMGTVYRATHLGLDRPVAVKVLKKEFAEDPEVVERFMREARTMARLRHARAAVIFDAGKLPDGRPFIVMEHVEGATLAEALARDGRFAPERAMRIACEICEVLAEAHRLGIVHRDLKPSNIMLNERGVCVLDFGIAKVLAGSADTTKTHATTESGLIIGTPRYMSPEQCTGQPVGPASDLYSVGVLLYEMLSGAPPFTDQLQSAVLVKQATQAPPPLLARRGDLARSLAHTVHALLAKNPTARPRTATEARRALERSLAPTSALEPEPNAHAPFAATLASLNVRATLAARAVTALTAVATLGAVCLIWSQNGTGWRADASTMNEATVAEARRIGIGSEGARAPSGGAASSLTPSAARQLAASVVPRANITEAQVARTRGGAVIAALAEDRVAGDSQLLLFEPRGPNGGFRLTRRVALDRQDFSGAKWETKVLDADGDGYDEILCTGYDAANDSFSRRHLLYAPRTRQAYTMRVGLDARESQAVRVKWSENAGGEGARAFRSAMRERAFADLPRARP